MFKPENISCFKFENWNYDQLGNKLILQFHYSLDSFSFIEKLEFPEIEEFELTDAAFQRACDILHVMLGVSYYKAAVPSRIEFQKQKLDQETARFFEEIYFHGLQEFAWENQLDLKERIKFPYQPQDFTSESEIQLGEEIIIPIGGGKDSLLCFDILRDQKVLLLTLGSNPVAKELSKEFGLPLVEVVRSIDPYLLELNQQGAYNGHVPFSAILAFVLALASLVYKKRYLVLGNERSANQANTSFLDVEVNHQYSKSYDCELKLNRIIKNKIHPETEYFSLLRQFSEVKIAQFLSQEKKLLGMFSSCNQSKKIQASDYQRWCGKCSKCCFVFLAFAPFLSEQELIETFGKNLFSESENLRHYQD